MGQNLKIDRFWCPLQFKVEPHRFRGISFGLQLRHISETDVESILHSPYGKFKLSYHFQFQWNYCLQILFSIYTLAVISIWQVTQSKSTSNCRLGQRAQQDDEWNCQAKKMYCLFFRQQQHNVFFDCNIWTDSSTPDTAINIRQGLVNTPVMHQK